MKILLLAILLSSPSVFAAGMVDSDKANHELFGAVVALNLPPCDEYNKFSCSTTVKDLFCKTVGGIHETKEGNFVSASEYRCTYTVSDPLNPEHPKPVNFDGSKAEALFVAMQHAKVKLSCDRSDSIEESACDTRMQNVRCGEGVVLGAVKYSCEVEPKYLLVQSAPKRKPSAYEGPMVINARTRKASTNGCHGDWVCEGVTNLGGQHNQDGAFSPDYKTAR
jgi:hypothetical protein